MGGGGTDGRCGYFSFNIVTDVALAERDSGIDGPGPSSSSPPFDPRTGRLLSSSGVNGGHCGQPIDGAAVFWGGGAILPGEEGIAPRWRLPIQIEFIVTYLPF